MAIKLYVGGLSFESTEAELRTFFEQAGEVLSVSIATDRDTGQSRGFAFVEMSETDGRKAISELNGKTLGDRSLRVEESRPRAAGRGRERW